MAVLLLVIDPVSIIARTYTRITPGCFVLEFLKNKLDGAHISVYLFNITNAEEFMSGKDYKIKVEEVGPFTYREIISIENLKLDEEAGVIRYSPRMEAVFVPEESIGHPEDINVTMPNLALLGLTSMLSSYPYLIRMAFNILVRQQKSKPITTLDAKSFMWGSPDPFVKLAKTVAPGLVNYDRLGALDQFYNVKKNDLVVGATEQDKFMIKTRNGHKKLMMSPLQDMELCTKCDTFNNTYEGMLYPAPVRPHTPIRLFRTGFCKLADFFFHEKRVLESGIEGLVFHFNYSIFENGPTHGLMDMSDCLYGFPISMSKVHLSDVDSELYERIDGMKPDVNYKYNNYIMIEPITGVQIDTYFSAQMNLRLDDLTFNAETRRFSNILLPTCYGVVKQPQLIEIIASILKILYVYLPLFLLITSIVLFLLAFVFLAYSVRILYCKKCSRSNVTSCSIITKIDENSGAKAQEPLITNSITNNNRSS